MDPIKTVPQVPSVLPIPPVPPLEPAGQPVQTPPPSIEVPPSANKTSLLFKFALFALLFSLIATGIYLVWAKVIPGVTKKACTMEAKVCPDGSSVGRVAPFCDFAPCPSPISTLDETANWKTYTTQFYSFKYPQEWEAQKPYTDDLGSETGFGYNYRYPFYVRQVSNYNQLTGKPYSSLQEYLGSRSGFVKDIQIDNHPAKDISNPGDEGHVIPSEEVLVFIPNQSFILSLYYQLDDRANIKTFDQILSTFIFLEATPSASPQR